MNVVVTGAGGFLGSRLANALLSKNSKLPVARLVLVDLQEPPSYEDPRVTTLAINITDSSAADRIIQSDVHVLFHLAAVLSGQAEVDLDLGLRVNFDATRALVDTARRKAPKLRFVYTSTVGVFGGNLPEVINDLTAVTPENSYGTEKAMCELLLNDYSRHGYVDARVVRLPTVSVRAGTANAAVTSFASGIVREPLNGEVCICPVDTKQQLLVTSPYTVVQNIIHAATLPVDALRTWRVVNLPGICISVGEMIEALREVAGSEAVSLVKFKRDEMIERMVATFPSKWDNTRALRLGFDVDKSFVDIIRHYIRDDLKRKV